MPRAKKADPVKGTRSHSKGPRIKSPVRIPKGKKLATGGQIRVPRLF